MRVLYVVREFPKLSETFILNEIIELSKLGHDISIITENYCPETVMHDDVIKYDILNKIMSLPTNYATGREKAFDFSKRLIIDFMKNPLKTIKTLFFIYGLNKNIWTILDNYIYYQEFRNKNTDIIYLTFSYPRGIDKTFCLSKMFGVPFILNFRAYDLYEKELQKDLISRLKFIGEASKIITGSNYNKENITKKLGIKNINVIYDSVSLKKFQPSHYKKDKKIITICRFIPQKGIRYLIETCKILQKRKIDCRCTIIGYGPEEQFYKNIIEKYSLSNIMFTGPRTQKQYKKELDTSAVFVLPCIIDKEGKRDILANVLKEAMAMGVPVVTSNICGIGELVEDGVSGILVPPKDPEAIADAIEKLFKNPKLREKMGKAGRKKIEKDFNIKTEIKKLEKIFYEAIKK